MAFLFLLLWAGLVSGFEQQYYDPSICSSTTINPGSMYTCKNGSQLTCQAFLLYRANTLFHTISDISELFGAETDQVLALNYLSTATEILEPGIEVLIPIDCLCSGQIYYANVTHVVRFNMSFTEIACGVFEGLVKSPVLMKENPFTERRARVGSELHVPVKCACPENDSSISSGVNHFLTYPFKPGDGLEMLAEKFGVSYTDILKANNITFRSTVFPNTTALVPLQEQPMIIISSSNPPPPSAFPTGPVEKPGNGKNARKLYISGSVVAISLLVFGFISCGLYLKAITQLPAGKYRTSSTGKNPDVACLSSQPSTPSSCLSPDLLAEVKYSLYKYNLEDLKGEIENLEKSLATSMSLYRGSINNTKVMIQQLSFKETRWVIDAHAGINHINILSLIGICNGDSIRTTNAPAFLVFESPGNGSLRDCLTSTGTSLQWETRKHIAFDIATGLHYLHHCITPPYANVAISSDFVFITTDWRAKIGNIVDLDTNRSSSRTNEDACRKAGIYGFGVVLLELITGKAVEEDCTAKRKKPRDLLDFLDGATYNDACYGNYFEQLIREFIDPRMKNDCRLTEALCFLLLAKACLENDPLARPSMNDIIKVHAKMV